MIFIQKLCFSIRFLVNGNTIFIKKKTIIHHLYDWFYENTYIFNLLIIFLLYVEIHITEKLFFGLYLLFFFPIIKFFFTSFLNIDRKNIILEICFVDYLNKNWVNCRYPRHFWNYFDGADFWFEKTYELNQEESKVVETMKNYHYLRFEQFRKISREEHENQLLNRITKSNNKNVLKLKKKASFLYTNGIRYFHSSKTLLYPLPQRIQEFHRGCAYFSRNIFDNIVLLNDNFSNHHIGLKLAYSQKFNIPEPKNLYVTLSDNIILRKNISQYQDFLDENLLTNFNNIKTKYQFSNFDKRLYDKTTGLYDNSSIINKLKSQPEPDLLISEQQKIYGYDLKELKNVGFGNSQIFSSKVYGQVLHNFKQHLVRNQLMTDEYKDIILNLQKLSLNPLDEVEYLKYWLDNFSKFEKIGLYVPLKVNTMINLSHFTHEQITNINNSYGYLKKVSNVLKKHCLDQPNSSKGYDPHYISKMRNKAIIDDLRNVENISESCVFQELASVDY